MTLSLTTDPHTEVYLDRRRLGRTPLSTKVPAGLVTLRAWAGEGPERRTANGSVELGPAEIRPIELRLAR